jgi:hypothetical protein
MGPTLFKWMLPLLLAATPAWAEDQATNKVFTALTVTTPAASSHLESSSKLERTPDAAGAKAKKIGGPASNPCSRAALPAIGMKSFNTRV